MNTTWHYKRMQFKPCKLSHCDELSKLAKTIANRLKAPGWRVDVNHGCDDWDCELELTYRETDWTHDSISVFWEEDLGVFQVDWTPYDAGDVVNTVMEIVETHEDEFEATQQSRIVLEYASSKLVGYGFKISDRRDDWIDVNYSKIKYRLAHDSEDSMSRTVTVYDKGTPNDKWYSDPYRHGKEIGEFNIADPETHINIFNCVVNSFEGHQSRKLLDNILKYCKPYEIAAVLEEHLFDHLPHGTKSHVRRMINEIRRIKEETS